MGDVADFRVSPWKTSGFWSGLPPVPVCLGRPEQEDLPQTSWPLGSTQFCNSHNDKLEVQNCLLPYMIVCYVVKSLLKDWRSLWLQARKNCFLFFFLFEFSRSMLQPSSLSTGQCQKMLHPFQSDRNMTLTNSTHTPSGTCTQLSFPFWPQSLMGGLTSSPPSLQLSVTLDSEITRLNISCMLHIFAADNTRLRKHHTTQTAEKMKSGLGGWLGTRVSLLLHWCSSEFCFWLYYISELDLWLTWFFSLLSRWQTVGCGFSTWWCDSIFKDLCLHEGTRSGSR